MGPDLADSMRGKQPLEAPDKVKGQTRKNREQAFPIRNLGERGWKWDQNGSRRRHGSH